MQLENNGKLFTPIFGNFKIVPVQREAMVSKSTKVPFHSHREEDSLIDRETFEGRYKDS